MSKENFIKGKEKQTKTEEQVALERITRLVKEVAPVYNVKQTTDGGYGHNGRYHSTGTIYIVYSKSEYNELIAVRAYGEFLKIKGIALKLTDANFQKILSDVVSIQNS